MGQRQSRIQQQQQQQQQQHQQQQQQHTPQLPSGSSPQIDQTTTVAGQNSNSTSAVSGTDATPPCKPNSNPEVTPPQLSSAQPVTSTVCLPPDQKLTPTYNSIVRNVRGIRYCEFLVVKLPDISFFSTFGLNDCPQACLDQQKLNAIAKQLRVDAILLNGPRTWVLDTIVGSQESNPEILNIGCMPTSLVATTTVPMDASGNYMDLLPYTPQTIQRTTVWIYKTGMLVYVLIDPSQKVYVMQSFSQEVDSSVTIDTLSALEVDGKIILPTNWTYTSKILVHELRVEAAKGQAIVVQDSLKNTYQETTKLKASDFELYQQAQPKQSANWTTIFSQLLVPIGVIVCGLSIMTSC